MSLSSNCHVPSTVVLIKSRDIGYHFEKSRVFDCRILSNVDFIDWSFPSKILT